MPARRKKSKTRIKSPVHKKKAIVLITVAAIFAIVILVFVSLFRNTPEYFTYTEAMDTGDINIYYVDLSSKDEFIATVPKDTEVNLGRRRGNLRASSVKKIIDSENVDGQILADTIIKTFHFPIDYWKSGGNTDMPLVLQLRYKFATISGINTQELDLSDTSYLISSKLPDGEEGYTVRDTMPLLLQSTFADPVLSSERLAVQIINETGVDPYFLRDVVSVLEVLGVKVAPISGGTATESGCVVKSLYKAALHRVSEVLNCEAVNAEPSAFDIEIILGKQFFERF